MLRNINSYFCSFKLNMSFLHRNIQTKSSKMRPNNFHILCKPVALTPAPCCKSKGHMPHALLQDIFERFRTQGFGLAPAIRKNIHFGDPGIADDLKDMGFMARGVGPKLWVSRRWASISERTTSAWWPKRRFNQQFMVGY